MYECNRCHKSFTSSQSVNAHARHCRLAEEGKTWRDVASESTLAAIAACDEAKRKLRPKCRVCGLPVKEMESIFCSAKCSRSAQRVPPKTEETKAKISASLSALPPKLKKRECLTCGAQFQPRTSRRKYCSNRCAWTAAGIRLQKYRSKSGGPRQGSGRSKSGWYRGIYCASTYELILVAYCLEREIPIERAPEGTPYDFNGRKYRYFPDFNILGSIYEVKGYVTEQSTAKANANPDVVIVDKCAIEVIKTFTSLAGKSQKEIVALYDSSPHRQYNGCQRKKRSEGL